MSKYVYDQVMSWCRATFGKAPERGPTGPAKHLVKEAKELLEALGPEGQLTSQAAIESELADCQILIWDIAYRCGLDFEGLAGVTKRKLAVCRTRNYSKPAGDEVCEHLPEPEINEDPFPDERSATDVE